jgi:hypothetical protein
MTEVKKPEEATVNLAVTAVQFNVIMNALNELPFKVVGAIIPELVQQVQAQINSSPFPLPAETVEKQ